MNNSASVVQVENLFKRYGETIAVNGISFEVSAGEVFGLLGPNGAGKTTTILSLMGLTQPTHGRILILNDNPVRNPINVKRHVGYIPDAVGFYDHMSARDNLRYTASLMGLSRQEADARIAAALQRLRLADVADKQVGTYSRGMRQRLALAEIIIKQARVAIMDEPTSGLDPVATEEFLMLIRDLANDGVAVMVSSHELGHMQRVCDRVALFSKGQIAMMGRVPELAEQVLGDRLRLRIEVARDDLGLARTMSMLTAVNKVERIGDGLYLLDASRDVRRDVLRALSAHDHELRQLTLVEPSLDEIYNLFFETNPVTTMSSSYVAA
jgi:ABC-2 type transport system ATP-binding protein